MQNTSHRYVGLVILTLAYPLTHFIVQYIPNPFVPSADIALNMIFPVLAGYFYGPLSGALAGVLGTGLSALIGADMFDLAAVLPHMLMGAAAGLVGHSRSHFLSALTIIIGHALNILFFWRFDLMMIDHVNTLLLGLLTETTIDVVAVILVMVLLQKPLYREGEQRW